MILFLSVIAIEKFWWSSKNYFNKRLLAVPTELDRRHFEQLVMESVPAVTTKKVHHLFAAATVPS